MAKAFSVASWNVEHFGAIDKKTKKPVKPIKPIIDYLAKQKADIVAIYEVRSKYVFQPILKTMPQYQFHITEGPQMQEILVGIPLISRPSITSPPSIYGFLSTYRTFHIMSVDTCKNSVISNTRTF